MSNGIDKKYRDLQKELKKKDKKMKAKDKKIANLALKGPKKKRWIMDSDIDKKMKKLEKDIDCCYSFQDKIWVSDPNGYNWEFFFVRDQEIIGNRDSVSEDCLSTECCE